MTQLVSAPGIRVQSLNQAPIHASASYVLYWMTAYRRCHWNFALQHALWWCQELKKPLIIFEPLRLAYPWANDRFHQFIIDGMKDQQKSCQEHEICYYPYLEEKHGDGKGLLHALSAEACVVITDEFPCFFLPKMIQAAIPQVSCLLQQVDSNGILPLRAAERSFTTAASFRRHLQKTILPFFQPHHFPHPDPLSQVSVARHAKIPQHITNQWPKAQCHTFDISQVAIDHTIAPTLQGGARSAYLTFEAFLQKGLSRYHQARNDIEQSSASGLSPYVHFGHLSTHQIVETILKNHAWHPNHVASKVTGSRNGWWGASEAIEGFLDQIITWREIGFNFCFHHPDDYDHYHSLPQWAQVTLDTHAQDPRTYLYDLEQFALSQTHDELWNAAQTQLRVEGVMHNYLRMLWGKKILEWTESPQVALQVLIELNNRYALDGRDPNSYSGIFWCLGRFDRAWGPERAIFGKIRYMSSDSTRRKLKVKAYISRYQQESLLF